jgi:hypothetical protein
MNAIGQTFTCTVAACAAVFTYTGTGSRIHPEPLCPRCYGRLRHKKPPVTAETAHYRPMRNRMDLYFSIPEELYRALLNSMPDGPDGDFSAHVRRILSVWVSDAKLRENTRQMVESERDCAAALRVAVTALRTPPGEGELWRPELAAAALERHDALFNERLRLLQELEKQPA